MRTKDEIFRTAYARLRMKGGVEGAGNMNRIKTRYRSRRKMGHTLESALVGALVATNGPEWYVDPSLGAPDKQGHRYVVAPSAWGLRFVGYSDELIGGRHHQGWYVHYDGGHDNETYRGCVFRLPGRDSKTLLLAGYYDKAGDGYVVDFSCIYTSIPDQHPVYTDSELYTAARAGDKMAETDAEECREHDYKWMQANRWQELVDSLKGVECGCTSADTERDRLQAEIKEIEGDFSDVAKFASEHI